MKRLAKAFVVHKQSHRSQTNRVSQNENCKKTITTETSRQHHVYLAGNTCFIRCENTARYAPAGILVAINILLRLANQISRKVVTNTLRLAPHPSVTRSAQCSPPPVGLVKVSSLRSLPSHSSPLNSRELS